MTRIGADTFRLEAPRLSRSKLGAGYAQRAVNCRVISGDLEPWKTNREEAQAVTKTGTIRSIHLMDPDASDGGPFLLQWTQIVSVVRGLRPSDTTDQTYYTGDGAPKVTNRTLATTGTQDPTGYPKGWYLLGVPAPTDTPILTLNNDDVEQGALTLENPFAEDGTNGWTIDTSVDPDGELLTTAIDPEEGNYAFQGGDAAITHAYQTLDMESLGLIEGQSLRMVYGQKSDDTDPVTGATAEMRLEFYNSAAAKISEYIPGQLSTAGVWTTRSHDGIIIPDDTIEIRLVQRYERTGTGPGALDAFIDKIFLIAGGAAFYSSGDSLADWTVSGAATVTVDTTTGNPAGSFLYRSGSSKAVSIFRNFRSSNSPSYTIQFDYTTHEQVFPAVVLDADAAGVGTQLRFNGTAIFIEQTGGWGSTNTSQTKIGDATYWRFTNTDNVWWRGFITVEPSGSKKKLTFRAIRVDTGLTMAENVTAEFDSIGDYIGFKAWDAGDAHNGWFDEIFVNIKPGSTTGTGDSIATYTDYVSTYVSEFFGDLAISAPSPASREVLLGLTPSIKVTTATSLPAGFDEYGITGKLLWRRVTATDGTTVYRLLTPTALPIAQADYLDTKLDSALEEAILDTAGWAPPPADAHSIVVGANGITYVASKNQTFPSAANQPHAYNPLWAVPLTYDYPVVGQASIASDVYALTQAHPYVITGTDPSAQSAQRLSKPLGCVSAASIATSERVGVIYASSDGLAYCNRADVGLLTSALLSEREWQQFNPSSIHGTVYDGYYVGFYDTGTERGGFIVDLSSDSLGLGRLDFFATALWLNPLTGNMHMVVDGVHVTFNTGDALMAFEWNSGLVLMDRPTSFERARIELGEGSGAVTMGVYYDDAIIATKAKSDSREFLLPAKVARDSAYFKLAGSRKVRRAMLAESIEELQWG